MSVRKRGKSLVDFIGFLLQASFFYIMAISLRSPKAFIMAYILMLSVDFAWLLSIGIAKYHKFQRTDIQWISSDFVIIGVYLLLHYFYRSNPTLWIIWVVMLVSIGAAVADYVINSDFYFPKEERSGG